MFWRIQVSSLYGYVYYVIMLINYDQPKYIPSKQKLISQVILFDKLANLKWIYIDLITAKLINWYFYSLEAVDRVSETQLQVCENCN